MKKLTEFDYTNGIPICPQCKVPTERDGSSGGTMTAMYFPPHYNKQGENTNPDRNIMTTNWHCCKCGKNYTVSGNDVDGYVYKSI
jgi:hypothetical protein